MVSARQERDKEDLKMNDVIVSLTDGKEIVLENAYFNVHYDYKSIRIFELNTENIIAIFNFDNVAGVRIG